MDKKARNSDIALYGLTPEYASLLSDICEYCSSTNQILDPDSEEAKKLKDWEGLVYRDFIVRHEELKPELKVRIEEDAPVKYSTFERSYDDLSPKSAKAIFIIAAQVYGRTVTEFLKDFIKYSNDRDTFKHKVYEDYNFQHRAFKQNDFLINKLLEKKEHPNLSLQDVVTITSEIDVIKCDLNMYPYGKGDLTKNDPTKNELALLKIDKLLAASPSNIDCLSFKVVILCKLKQKRGALKLSSKLLKLDGENLEAIKARIFALGTFKKTKEALNLARKTQNIYPNSPSLSHNISSLLERLGKYSEAIEEYMRAISLDSDFLRPYYRIAYCYHRLNQFEQCESALKSAHHIASENIEILSKLMSTLVNQGKEDEAIQYAKKLINAKDSGVLSDYMLAAIELSEDNIAGAKTIIKDLLSKLESNLFETNENKSTAHYLLSVLFQAAYEENPKNTNLIFYAKDSCSDALELNPKNCAALSGMARASFQIGERKDAKQYLDKISDIYKNTSINELFGWVCYIQISRFAREKCKHPDHALPLIWCSEKYSDDILCNIAIAHEYLLSKDFDGAKTHVDKAFEITESNAEYKINSVVNSKILHELGQLHQEFEDVCPQQGLYLRRAIELFKNPTTDFVKSKDIYLWREAMSDMGDALRALGFANNDENAFADAICAYKEALIKCPRYKYREVWINLNNAIGNCYGNIGELNNNLDDFNTAIKYKKEMLQEITLENDRDAWLSHMHHIADLLIIIGKEYSERKTIEDAIELYNSLLDVLNNDLDAEEQAKVKVCLGNADIALGEIAKI